LDKLLKFLVLQIFLNDFYVIVSDVLDLKLLYLLKELLNAILSETFGDKLLPVEYVSHTVVNNLVEVWEKIIQKLILGDRKLL